MAAQQRKKDLKTAENCRNDLQDDYNDISNINRQIDELQKDLGEALLSDRVNRIISGLEEIMEPSQGLDPDIRAAVNALDNEIAALRKEIEAEEEAERVARESRNLLG